jgi:hypothetical protein
MSSRSFAGLAALLETSLVLASLCACTPGTKPGALVGRYAVHGVLVENSCGQSALAASSSLDFVVEIRVDSGVAYWNPVKATPSSGTLTTSGDFRFTMSETQVVSSGMRQLEPGDFANASANPDFDLQRSRACALTRKQTVKGNLGRRIEDGVVTDTSASKRSSDAGYGDADGDDDLDAEHVIEVAPTSGSDCNVALAALGGPYLTLPCEARYLLSGNLDTRRALTSAAGNGGKQADAGR